MNQLILILLVLISCQKEEYHAINHQSSDNAQNSTAGNNIKVSEIYTQTLPENSDLVSLDLIESLEIDNQKDLPSSLYSDQTFSPINLTFQFISGFYFVKEFDKSKLTDKQQIQVANYDEISSIPPEYLKILNDFIKIKLVYYTNLRNALIHDNWEEITNITVADMTDLASLIYYILNGSGPNDGSISSTFTRYNASHILEFFGELIISYLNVDTREFSSETIEERIYQNSHQSVQDLYVAEDSLKNLIAKVQVRLDNITILSQLIDDIDINTMNFSLQGQVAFLCSWLVFLSKNKTKYETNYANGENLVSKNGQISMLFSDIGWEMSINEDFSNQTLNLTAFRWSSLCFFCSRTATDSFSETATDAGIKSLSRNSDEMIPADLIAKRIEGLEISKKAIRPVDPPSKIKEFELNIEKANTSRKFSRDQIYINNKKVRVLEKQNNLLKNSPDINHKKIIASNNIEIKRIKSSQDTLKKNITSYTENIRDMSKKSRELSRKYKKYNKLDADSKQLASQYRKVRSTEIDSTILNLKKRKEALLKKSETYYQQRGLVVSPRRKAALRSKIEAKYSSQIEMLAREKNLINSGQKNMGGVYHSIWSKSSLR